ncbi:MAG: hypothetical protein RI911_38, partial [Candidatus Parcubacteria bacterium]
MGEAFGKTKKPPLERVPPSKHPLNQNLGDVVSFLYEETALDGHKVVTESPRECRIERNVSPKMIEQISSLSFEIMLTEHDEGLTLVTGTKDAGWTPDDPETNIRTKRNARFTLHNHPSSFIANPSFGAFGGGDIGVSEMSNSEVDFIVGKHGITIHKNSRDTNATSVDRALSYRGMLADFRGEDHTLRFNLKKGFVDGFIPWTETDKIQLICDYINGTSQWGEY